MKSETKRKPAGTRATNGVVHKSSPVSVAETVLMLSAAIRAAGATLFFVVDHSGEAQRAGLEMRDTKLLGFGSPAHGTPAMVASPLAALDLPLKILVWANDDGSVWMSYADPAWLARRYALNDELAAPLSALDQVTAQVTTEER
jgi:uncharacterized protein (DUF302 family)